MMRFFCRRTAGMGRLLLIPALLLLLPHTAQALESDNQQPINILADNARFYPDKGQATYSGRVEIDQGSLKISAHEVTIHRSSSGEIEKIIARGQKQNVHLQQKPNPQDPVVHAYAMQIVYQAASQQIELEKSARLENGQDSFSGERIRYHLQNKRIQAWGQDSNSDNPQGEGRVKITLFPKGENSTP